MTCFIVETTSETVERTGTNVRMRYNNSDGPNKAQPSPPIAENTGYTVSASGGDGKKGFQAPISIHCFAFDEVAVAAATPEVLERMLSCAGFDPISLLKNRA